MRRKAFIFKIKPELKDEFKKDHDNIWPEVIKVMKDAGERNLSINFRKDGTLFVYLEIDDSVKASPTPKSADINDRWGKHLERYFVKDDSSVAGPEIEMLEELFHVD